MLKHLFNRPLPVRLLDPHGVRDERINVFSIRIIDERLVVQVLSGEGYHYLPRPHARDADGTLVALWVDDVRASQESEHVREVYPSRSRRLDSVEHG